MMDNSDVNNEIPLLTFNSLYNILREEKRTKTLGQLPNLFYEAVKNYIIEKQKEIKNLSSVDLEKKRREQHVLKKSKEIIFELLNIRLSKISNIIIKNSLFSENSMSTDNILEFEFDIAKDFESGIKKIKRKLD